MGARFSGLDHELILSLPPPARLAFRGLTFFEQSEKTADEETGAEKTVRVQGGCDFSLAEKLIVSKSNLTEIARDLASDADARQRQLYVRYVRFVSTPQLAACAMIESPSGALRDLNATHLCYGSTQLAIAQLNKCTHDGLLPSFGPCGSPSA